MKATWVKECDALLPFPMPVTVDGAVYLLKRYGLLPKRERAAHFYVTVHPNEVWLVRKSINCAAYTLAALEAHESDDFTPEPGAAA